MTRIKFLIAPIVAGVLIFVAGYAMLTLSSERRLESVNHEALDEAVQLSQKIQGELLALLQLLTERMLEAGSAPWGKSTFSDHPPQKADRYLWWKTGAIWHTSPSMPTTYQGIGRQLSDSALSRSQVIIGPLTTDDGEDLLLVGMNTPNGWLGISLPVSQLVAPWEPRAAADDTLTLQGERGHALYRASPVIPDNTQTVEFPVPGEQWRLSVGTHAEILHQQTNWALLILTLLIAYGCSMYVFALGRRPRTLGLEMAELEERYQGLTEDLLTAITAHESTRTELKQLTSTDSETGVPNRQGFIDAVDQALVTARKQEVSGVAIGVIGIDDLERIAKTFGRETLSTVLALMMQRLKSALHADELLARLDNVRFAILWSDADEPTVTQRAGELLQVISNGGYPTENQVMYVEPHIGISPALTGHMHATTLLDAALIALEEADEQDTRWAIYTDHARDTRITRLQLEMDLRGAIERNELRLFYQPIVETSSRKPRGFECLIRWQHPTEGLLSPASFITLAENAGLISDISRWVLRQAITQASQWNTLKAVGGYLSVNLSAVDLFKVGLRDEITTLLREADLNERMLRIEVTESALIKNMAGAKRVLSELDAQGIALVMDDFGTGFSSLSYLRQLPFQVVKIDRSFVSSMAEQSKDFGIVKNIIGLVRYLGMESVAEGVESEDQRQLLEMVDADYCQGYLFARPMPVSEAEAYLHHQAEITGMISIAG